MTHKPFQVINFTKDINRPMYGRSISYNGSNIDENNKEWYFYCTTNPIPNMDTGHNYVVRDGNTSPSTYYDLIKIDSTVFKISISNDPLNMTRTDSGTISY